MNSIQTLDIETFMGHCKHLISERLVDIQTFSIPDSLVMLTLDIKTVIGHNRWISELIVDIQTQDISGHTNIGYQNTEVLSEHCSL